MGMSLVVMMVPLSTSTVSLDSAAKPVKMAHSLIKLSYAIQFTSRPSTFRGVHFTAVKPVPPAKIKGFYSLFFIILKRLWPILGQCIWNHYLHKMPFKMLSKRRILRCIRSQDWFAVLNLKDVYIRVYFLSCHRPFLQFAFKGRAWQYKLLYVWLALAPFLKKHFLRLSFSVFTCVYVCSYSILFIYIIWIIYKCLQMSSPWTATLLWWRGLSTRLNLKSYVVGG